MALPRRRPDAQSFWRKLVGVMASIPFAEDLVAAWYCALDPSTPSRVRVILFGAVAYFVMPADAVPDILAGIGFTDDAAVIAAVVAALGRHIRPDHRARARRRLDELARG